MEPERLLLALLFSIGLVLVVVAGAELFTGNIIMVVGLIGGRYSWAKLFKNWGAVYLGNLVGALAYALLMWKSGLFGSPGSLNHIGELAVKVAEAKALLPFGEAFIRGVFCNILVILAIIMSLMAKDVVSKVVICMLPIAAFVTAGFEHCVANMFLMPIGFLAAENLFGGSFAIVMNILAVTLGNIVGGVFIIIIHPNRLRQLRFLRRQSRTPLIPGPLL